VQTVVNKAVFIATGNQLIISGDLPRRSLLCRLTPNVATPETRVFAFDPVTRAREGSPELATAALTAARYYLRAGCPAPRYAQGVAVESGSFTEWNRVVRGLPVHLGFGDPLITQKEVRAENPMLENDIELAAALCKLFPRTKKFSAKEIQRPSHGFSPSTANCTAESALRKRAQDY
jgi:putative DNA primase/helicase